MACTGRPLNVDEWAALKREALALNVVTEHNLDVLSVLNHAMNHAYSLGLQDTEDLHFDALKHWRDGLREGIFGALWDETGWVEEFRAEIARHPQGAQAKSMQAILDSGEPLGRFVTGGGDVALMGGVLGEPSATYEWNEKSVHSAIDNCSWLSLSVDYDDLERMPVDGAASKAIDKLARCLRYTIIRYAKPLGFFVQDEDCPEQGLGNGESEASSCDFAHRPTYYGAHNFQNTFRDPYIAPSKRQASSYHLEATMGLVQGLLTFVDAHPENLHAPSFERVAQRMWVDAQRFTRDHGFPYSSQRIHNLSTRLSSSTAIIWFIDVYHYFESRGDEARQEFADALEEPGSFDFDQAVMVSKFKPKNGSFQMGRGLYSGFKTLLNIEPQLAAFVVPLALSAGYGLSGENDVALETMVVFDDVPGPEWSEVGTVRADEVMQGLGPKSGLLVFFRPEEELRRSGSYESIGAHTRPYEAEKIYGFDLREFRDLIPRELLSPESGTGAVSLDGFDLPKAARGDSRIKLYVLNTEKARDEIVDDFLSHHLWWTHVLQIAAYLPQDGMQENWLATMRGMFLGWFFDAKTAGRFASKGNGGQTQEGRPFWWHEGPAKGDVIDPHHGTDRGSTIFGHLGGAPFPEKGVPLVEEKDGLEIEQAEPGEWIDAVPKGAQFSAIRIRGPRKPMVTVAVGATFEPNSTTMDTVFLNTEHHEVGVTKGLLAEMDRLAGLTGVDISQVGIIGIAVPKTERVIEDLIQGAVTLRQRGEPIYVLSLSVEQRHPKDPSKPLPQKVVDGICAALHDANAEGVLVVSSAGNSGIPNSTSCPASLRASHDNLLAVTGSYALTSHSGGQLLPKSSYGQTADIAAAGISATSIDSRGRESEHDNPAMMLGSSYVAPHAAAPVVIAAAVSVQHSPSYKPSPRDLKKLVLKTTHPKKEMSPLSTTQDPLKGLSSLNPIRLILVTVSALELIPKSGHFDFLVAADRVMASGQELHFEPASFRIPFTEKRVLVWDDTLGRTAAPISAYPDGLEEVEDVLFVHNGVGVYAISGADLKDGMLRGVIRFELNANGGEIVFGRTP